MHGVIVANSGKGCLRNGTVTNFSRGHAENVSSKFSREKIGIGSTWELRTLTFAVRKPELFGYRSCYQLLGISQRTLELPAAARVSKIALTYGRG